MADEKGARTGILTFSMQIGLVRESVTVEGGELTLATLKEIACAFVDRKVSLRLTSVSKSNVLTLLCGADFDCWRWFWLGFLLFMWTRSLLDLTCVCLQRHLNKSWPHCEVTKRKHKKRCCQNCLVVDSDFWRQNIARWAKSKFWWQMGDWKVDPQSCLFSGQATKKKKKKKKKPRNSNTKFTVLVTKNWLEVVMWNVYQENRMLFPNKWLHFPPIVQDSGCAFLVQSSLWPELFASQAGEGELGDLNPRALASASKIRGRGWDSVC